MATANQTIKKVLNHLNSKIGTGGVVDSWSDGQGNFWRKYADGWIEQGGKIPNGNAWTWYTATLNIPFTTTSYTLLSGVSVTDGTSDANQQANGYFFGTKSTNSFRYRQLDDIANPSGEWFACGY